MCSSCLLAAQALPWGMALAYIAAWGPGCLPSLEVWFVRSSGLGLCGGGGGGVWQRSLRSMNGRSLGQGITSSQGILASPPHLAGSSV